MPLAVLDTTEPQSRERAGFIGIDDIFSQALPETQPTSDTALSWLVATNCVGHSHALALSELVSRLEACASSTYEQGYVGDLRRSLRSLQGRRQDVKLRSIGTSLDGLLVQYRARCEDQVTQIYTAMVEAAVIGEEVDHTQRRKVPDRYQRPRLSPTLFLQCLRQRRWQKLSAGWRDWLVAYGVALVRFQQAERLLALSNSPAELTSELQNTGHTN